MEGLNYATLAMHSYSGAGDLSVGLLLLLWHACERLTSSWLCYWWQCVHQEEKWCKKKKGSCEHNNLSPVVEVFNRSNCSVLYLLLNLIDQWLFFSVVAGCFDSVGRFLGKCQQSFFVIWRMLEVLLFSAMRERNACFVLAASLVHVVPPHSHWSLTSFWKSN